ncbi:hypothetical protein KEM52_001904 [Ascosphaera acerosa]|nr:hypothetical protein KEM52_001904 [Ascosphaera acerosa]
MQSFLKRPFNPYRGSLRSVAPATHQLLIVEPSCPVLGHDVPRRQRTPAQEASQSHFVAVICPTAMLAGKPSEVLTHVQCPFLAADRTIFPLGEAEVVCRVGYTAAPHQGVTPFQLLQTHPVRHVLLPFDLHANPSAFNNERNRDLIEQLLPNIVSVRLDDAAGILVFSMSHMPAHILPQTVAGVPVYFATGADDLGPVPAGVAVSTSTSCDEASHEGADRGGSGGVIDAPDLHGEAVTDLDIIDVAADHFAADRAPVLEMHLWKDRLTVILDVSQDLTASDIAAFSPSLPSSIAGRRIEYLPQSHPQYELATTMTTWDPRDDHCWRDGADCCLYDNLQPGVMLTTGRPSAFTAAARTAGIGGGSGGGVPATPPEILSSSGIMVVDGAGERFMTVSRSQFPYGSEVYHPIAAPTPTSPTPIASESHPSLAHAYTRHIGRIVRTLADHDSDPGSDVALVALAASELLDNRPFQNCLLEQTDWTGRADQDGGKQEDSTAPDGGDNADTHLQPFASCEEVAIGTPAWINSPVTGFKRGSLGALVRIRILERLKKDQLPRWTKARLFLCTSLSPRESGAPVTLSSDTGNSTGTSHPPPCAPRLAGLAGTPVWDAAGRVLGLVRGDQPGERALRHALYMVPAESLQDAGLSVSVEHPADIHALRRSHSLDAMLY